MAGPCNEPEDNRAHLPGVGSGLTTGAQGKPRRSFYEGVMLTRHWLRHVCPHCGTEQSAVASSNSLAAPDPGDVTVCIDCLRISVFDEHMQPRKPTPDELRVFARDPDIARMGAMAMLAKHKL